MVVNDVSTTVERHRSFRVTPVWADTIIPL